MAISPIHARNIVISRQGNSALLITFENSHKMTTVRITRERLRGFIAELQTYADVMDRSEDKE